MTEINAKIDGLGKCSSDKTVTTAVVDQTKKFYELAGVPESNIKHVKNMNAGHSVITDNDDGDVTDRQNHQVQIYRCQIFQHEQGCLCLCARVRRGKKPAKHRLCFIPARIWQSEPGMNLRVDILQKCQIPR